MMIIIVDAPTNQPIAGAPTSAGTFAVGAVRRSTAPRSVRGLTGRATRCSVKPSEAAGFLKSSDSLSIKQLKNIMKAKVASMEAKKRTMVLSQLDQIVEKPSLVKFVEEHVQRSEIDGLLSTSGASSSSSSSDGRTTSSSSSSSSSGSKSKQGARSSQPGSTATATVAPPTPQQMRQQASVSIR